MSAPMKVNMKALFQRAPGALPLLLPLLLPILPLLAGAPAQAKPVAAVAGVEIRRTTDGIPHLRAANWRDLGMGVGYVQAQDALCTLAEAFVTYEGRRAWFFGADAKPERSSTLGKPKNVDLDFFFRAHADDTVLARYRVQQPAGLNQLVAGFAAGYNRYLADARGDRKGAGTHACLDQPWVREISADDILRRMYAAQIAAGYAKFITEIANAKPGKPAAAALADDGATLRGLLAQNIGDQPGIGSNMFALGREATGADEAVLFGSPHWYWGGPDRFYQMHLTIPGQVDVAGVAFLGVPVVMIGFNNDVAWSHTVSAARRFGLFDLTLDPADPTRYKVDDGTEAMTAREVSVEVRAADGTPERLTRTFYQSRYGPVLDLGRHNPAFGWGATHAMAIRDVNADNFRVFSNFFYWNRAKSLDDFIAIQRREAAVPWVNTMAIGRGDGRVWYGDIGALPNAPDALRQDCGTQLGAGFAQMDPYTPVLDGSRSACAWRQDPAAKQAGAMPAAAQPWLLRTDYAANMNDSYWLSNARQPLTGFPLLMGGEGRPLELRGRLGHHIALDILRDGPTPAEALSRRVMRDVLAPRLYSAELYKDEVLAAACAQPVVALDAAALKAAGVQAQAAQAADAPPRQVETVQACDVLRRWPNTGEADDRGALLWEALWARLKKIPGPYLAAQPFSPTAALETPRGLQADDGRAATALAATVLEFGAKDWPLDEALGKRRYVASGGQRWPLYGGCHSAGYFTVTCGGDAGSQIGADAVSNTYLQVVRFTRSGVRAHTLLAHGQDETAVSNGGGAAPVIRYTRKEWLSFPFREDEIARDRELTLRVLRP